MTRRWARTALAAVVVTVASACSANFGTPDAATEQGEEMQWLWRIFFVLAVAVAALIWVLVLVAVVRYRRRRHDDPDAVPSQRQYNIPLEVAYTAAPLVLVAVLFGLTVVVTNRMTETTPDPDVTIEVIGFQWQWQFRYPDDGIVLNGDPETGPQMVVPVGATVSLQLRADDVNHSFWVPDFLDKRDLIPGVDNELQFTVTEPGEWVGRCAEYCGLDHWKMRYSVRAVPEDEYERWLEETSALPQPVFQTGPQTTTEASTR